MTAQTEQKTTSFSLSAYQAWTDNTAVYPHAGSGDVQELMYAALGLTGEAGEVSNKIKKLFRDGDNAEKRAELAKEIGDVMWYVARLARVLDINLEEVLAANQAKLESRKARGVLGGNGDNR